jgi:hypothetical protein
MFEHKGERVLGRAAFYRRLALSFGFSCAVVFGTLLMGVCGYHYLDGLAWIDALVNASMLLGGMGPVDTLNTVAGKLFASFYALFCGLVLIAAVGILFAPIAHRFLHKFHLEMEEEDEGRQTGRDRG